MNIEEEQVESISIKIMPELIWNRQLEDRLTALEELIYSNIALCKEESNSKPPRQSPTQVNKNL